MLHLEGWRQFRKLARREKKFTHLIKQAKLRSFRTAPWYKYGYQVPKDYNEAKQIDIKNGNTRWQDASDLEMGMMQAYEVFEDHNDREPPPPYIK